MAIRYDFIEIKADVSPEGWIRDKPVITRSGIFSYRSADGKLTREYRPDAEVFADASLSSLAGIPITDGHRGLVNSDNPGGIVGTVTSPGAKQETNVVADIVIHDSKRIGSRRELSLGYRCDVDETPGVTEKGEKYDAVQTNIKYNHLAVVNRGRAGNARLRLDGTDAVHGAFDQEDEMAEQPPRLVTIRLDDIDYQGSPEVQKRMEKYETDLAGLRKQHDEMEAERDTLRTSLAAEKESSAKAAKTAVAAAKARMKLEEIASKAGLGVKEDESDRDIKVKVITKIRGNAIKFDDKSDDYVNSAFDFVIIDQADKDGKLSEQRRQSSERKDEKPSDSGYAARERMLARIRGEKEAA